MTERNQHTQISEPTSVVRPKRPSIVRKYIKNLVGKPRGEKPDSFTPQEFGSDTTTNSSSHNGSQISESGLNNELEKLTMRKSTSQNLSRSFSLGLGLFQTSSKDHSNNLINETSESIGLFSKRTKSCGSKNNPIDTNSSRLKRVFAKPIACEEIIYDTCDGSCDLTSQDTMDSIEGSFSLEKDSDTNVVGANTDKIIAPKSGCESNNELKLTSTQPSQETHKPGMSEPVHYVNKLIQSSDFGNSKLFPRKYDTSKSDNSIPHESFSTLESTPTNQFNTENPDQSEHTSRNHASSNYTLPDSVPSDSVQKLYTPGQPDPDLNKFFEFQSIQSGELNEETNTFEPSELDSRAKISEYLKKKDAKHGESNSSEGKCFEKFELERLRKSTSSHSCPISFFTNPSARLGVTAHDDSLLLKHLIFMHKSSQDPALYFKWGLWLQEDAEPKSLSLIMYLETEDNLNHANKGINEKPLVDMALLRQGIHPNRRCDKIAFQLRTPHVRDFFQKISRLIMFERLSMPLRVYVPVIGTDLNQIPNEYVLVKLWLGAKLENNVPYHTQIQNLSQRLINLLPTEFTPLFESAVYVHWDGQTVPLNAIQNSSDS